MTTLAFLCCLAALELSPAPQKIIADSKNVFQIHPGVAVVVADQATEAELALLKPLFTTIGYNLPVYRAAQYTGSDGAIFLGVTGRHAALDRRSLRRFSRDAEKLPSGGYRLSVWRRGAVIAGSDGAGAFYGLQTLLQLAAPDPISWPCVDITDWPDLPVRGAYMTGMPTRDRLEALAKYKCNWAVFDSPDFQHLEGIKREAWQRAFDDARSLYIEPVPLLSTLGRAETLLTRSPAAAEGRVTIDRIVLRSDDPALLSRRNILATETNPIEVWVSQIPCRPLEDYVIQPGETMAPYDALSPPWLIRRMPGGVIPDGATVTLRYTYAPPGTSGICPYAPEAEALVEETLRALVNTLRPNYLHIDQGTISRLNQDRRTQRQEKSNAEVFSDAVALLGRVRKIAPDITLLLWADLLNPHQEASRFDLAAAADKLPPKTWPIARLPEDGTRGMLLQRRSLDWLAARGAPFAAMTMGGPAQAYALCEGVAERAGRGVLVPGGAGESAAFRVAMEKAWSNAQPSMAWPGGLNAHFGAALWRPDYTERLDTMVGFLNRESLAGNSPEEVYRTYETMAKGLAPRLPQNDPDLDAATRLIRNLTDYLSAETAFHVRGDKSALRRVAGIARNQAALDPALNAERLDRIVDTIEKQQLFPPASILFGAPLLYARPMSLPQGRRIFEMPVRPEYRDTEGRAEATFDLMGIVGEVARIEYETVQASRVRLEHSDDGRAFTTAQEWTPTEAGWVRGPALVRGAVEARYLRLAVEAAGGTAVLRETRLFLLKEPATANCPFTVETGRRGGGPEIAWPVRPQVTGFLREDIPGFTEAPTEVRLCRNRTHLFVGVRAKEPRMSAMTADLVQRDAPLWEQESVEIWLRPPDGGVFRFVANPLGAQYDSLDWDAGWDGDWVASTEKEEDGWVAILALPFELFGEEPRRGARWFANFKRNRCNVETETSTWALDYHSTQPYQYGTLTFE